MNEKEQLELKRHANNVRLGIIEAVYNAGCGHPGGSLSIADMLTYLYFEEMKKRAEEAGKPGNLIVTDFVSNMADALSAANLVVSRAGAGSISEFALLGKAVILVPSPNVSEDHQTKNAMALVDKGAAIYVADAKAKEELVSKAIEVVNDEEKIASLEKNIEKMGRPNAAEEIADEVIMLADAYIEKETRREKENLK